MQNSITSFTETSSRESERPTSGNSGAFLKSCLPNLGMNPVCSNKLCSQGTVIYKAIWMRDWWNWDLEFDLMTLCPLHSHLACKLAVPSSSSLCGISELCVGISHRTQFDRPQYIVLFRRSLCRTILKYTHLIQHSPAMVEWYPGVRNSGCSLRVWTKAGEDNLLLLLPLDDVWLIDSSIYLC